MNQIIFYILYPLLWALSKLPFRVLYGISTACYYLLYYIFGYRKKVIVANLKMTFPERSYKDQKRITKQFYRHMCDLIVESLKSLTISEQELRRRFVYENLEYCHELYQKNRSVIIMCGHYA